MSLRRNFIWMVISRCVSLAALFITGSLINRSLGPLGVGILAEMQTWVGLFMVVFGMGIDAATYHFTNKIAYPYDVKTKFTTIFILNIIYAILAASALTFFVFYWPQKISSKTIEFLFLLDIFLIVSMVTTNLVIFFQALGNIKFSALLGIIRAVINILIICTGYFLGLISIGFVVVSMLVVQVITLFMVIRAAFKSGFISGYFSKEMAICLFTKGIKQHIGAISAFIYIKINQLIVFKYCGEEQSGIFAVALTLALYLTLVPETFQLVLYPRVIHSDDDYKVTANALKFGFYVWGAIVILIIIFAKPILLMYGGKKFLASINAFRILMFMVWFLPLSSLIAPYFAKKGAFGLSSLFAVCLGIISTGLNLFLVPKYASVGAAFATSISCFIGFCMVILLLFYLSKKNTLIIFKPDFKKEISFIRQVYLRKV